MESQSLESHLKFDGKTVVITGSGTGIGQAIAKKFAENGANIVIMGRRKEPLQETSGLLESIIMTAGSSAKVRLFSGVDVSDEKGINEMFDTVKKEFGKVDIIVNNAGVSGPVKAFTNADFKEFKDCVAIHLTGTFWTSVQGLNAMESGSKIITIATFFSEENRYEQRPYRFRTPYTAAQGAKNRLAEALAWELVEKGIRSIATNPGPVHSDRIYKTVYPKAAAEFVRIGGYPGLTPLQVDKIAPRALQLLGEPELEVSKGIKEIALDLAQEQKSNSAEMVDSYTKTISGLLAKIQEIAEKVQNNTSKMIVDNEFLTQEDVAEMVLTLSSEKISKLINGRVIPNDRVFYPVKPIVGTAVDGVGSNNGSNNELPGIKGKVVVLTSTSSRRKEIDRVKKIAKALGDAGAKQTIVLTNDQSIAGEFREFHSHVLDLSDEDAVRRIFNTARTKFEKIDAIVHFTGDYDYESPLTNLARNQWDLLVDNFINIPGLITRESVNVMAPQGAVDEPKKYKDSKGFVIIVGPDAPVGRKISGTVRARSDVFRGALRPYTATVNQELGDVLGSKIRLYLVLGGNTEGTEPNADKLESSIMHLLSGSALGRNESIFYIDEARI